jgi:phosphodiesterase/alkaline phosphatase D-like protein
VQALGWQQQQPQQQQPQQQQPQQQQPQNQQNPQNVTITNGPTVEDTQDTSAVIAWSTNVNASTAVKYGTDRNNLDQTAQAPWGGLTHRVTLSNLKPNTTYYFRVESAQAQGTGTQALSDISQFQTKAGGQAAANQGSTQQPSAGAGASSAQSQGQTPRIVAGPVPQQITDKSVVIWWQTTAPAPSNVKYGTDPNNLSQTASAQANEQTHKVPLSNLQPSTRYYFTVIKPDGSSHTIDQFEAKPANYAQAEKVQITDGPVFEFLSDNQAVIAWTTNVPSSTRVRYGDTEAMNQTAEGQWGTNHRVTLTGLKPNQGYHFESSPRWARALPTWPRATAPCFPPLLPASRRLRPIRAEHSPPPERAAPGGPFLLCYAFSNRNYQQYGFSPPGASCAKAFTMGVTTKSTSQELDP